MSVPSSIPPIVPPTMMNTKVLLSSSSLPSNSDSVVLTEEIVEYFPGVSFVEVVVLISIYRKSYRFIHNKKIVFFIQQILSLHLSLPTYYT